MLEEADLKWNVSEKSKVSQNVQLLRFFEAGMGFWIFFTFLKIGKCSKLL